jgi:D-glycero-alpha-D-manno-heptose 1-phosphate guanylyltransferase
MEAIVLAGGFGTRLREVVPDLPKPMAPIAGRPFLEILLNDLAHKGFKRVVLSLGYKAQIIISHFGDQFAGMGIAYAVEETPLGTGGAARLGLSQCRGDHAFIFNGDTFLDLEARAVEILWQRHKQPIIVAREVSDTARYGRLLTEGGRVTGFTEKGVNGQGLINAGCYVLGAGQLNAWPLNMPFSLEADYFTEIVKTERLNIFKTQGVFIDIGVPEDYLRAQALLVNRT